MQINWDEFKTFKNEMPHLKGDNFIKLVYFIKSFYNEKSYQKIFNILQSDEISKMMLEKRGIKTAYALEKFINEYK